MTHDELAKGMKGKRWFWVQFGWEKMVDRLVKEGRAENLSAGTRRHGPRNSIRTITRRARIR